MTERHRRYCLCCNRKDVEQKEVEYMRRFGRLLDYAREEITQIRAVIVDILPQPIAEEIVLYYITELWVAVFIE